MFEEGRKIVEMKTAEKHKTKLSNRPQSKWNSLLVNKRLSPEQLLRGVERVLSPPKYIPSKYSCNKIKSYYSMRLTATLVFFHGYKPVLTVFSVLQDFSFEIVGLNL